MPASSPVVLFLAYAVMLFLAMYLFVYVPSRKKQKKQQNMHDRIAPGDEIITLGGIIGIVAARDNEYVELIIDQEKNVKIRTVIYAVHQLIKSSDSGLS